MRHTSSFRNDLKNEENKVPNDAGSPRKSESRKFTKYDESVKCIVDFSTTGGSNPVHNFMADELHSTLMFFRIILFVNTFDTILGWIVSAGATCFFFYYKPEDSNNSHIIFNLNWTMLSIALVFPLTMTLTETFRRREAAVTHLMNLRTNIISLFVAHKDWDFYTIPDRRPEEKSLSGRNDLNSRESARLSSNHVSELRCVLCRFIDMTFTVLSAPRVSQARHFYTKDGREQRNHVKKIQDTLDDSIIVLYHEISAFGEKFKEAGLPAGEKSRLTAFENSVISSYFQLRALKNYRSPMGLRAYARLFTILTPLVFGPYYGLLAESTSLSWSICFSIITTSAMQGLFNIRHELEDPFSGDLKDSYGNPLNEMMLFAGDKINLHEELNQLKQDIKIIHECSDSPDVVHKLFMY